jgi:hypothetical protein
MSISTSFRRQVIMLYCIIFYALMIFKWVNGLFLYQVEPPIFNNRFDMFTWVFMKTGIHLWLLNNPKGWILFDVAFYTAPIIFLFTAIRFTNLSRFVAFLMLIINWTYIQCFTLYPTNSIESYTAWLLFPVLFMTSNAKTFQLLFESLRYFFLFFFASAGLWKIVQLSVFQPTHMSSVLLFQHAEYLATSPGYVYSNFIYWLIDHPAISYALYIAGTLLELIFFIGFFTKKYDRLLLLFFLAFLLFDIIIMRIHYWEVSAFLITLWLRTDSKSEAKHVR